MAILNSLMVNGPTQFNGPITGLKFNGPADSAEKDSEGNVISETYAKSANIPTNISDLNNDLGFIQSDLQYTNISNLQTCLKIEVQPYPFNWDVDNQNVGELVWIDESEFWNNPLQILECLDSNYDEYRYYVINSNNKYSFDENDSSTYITQLQYSSDNKLILPYGNGGGAVEWYFEDHPGELVTIIVVTDNSLYCNFIKYEGEYSYYTGISPKYNNFTYIPDGTVSYNKLSEGCKNKILEYVPTKTSQLNNDAGFITASYDSATDTLILSGI